VVAVTIRGLVVEAPVVALPRWLLLLPVLPLFPHQQGPRYLPGSIACCLLNRSVALLAPVRTRRLARTLVLWYFGSCGIAVTGSLSGPRKLFKGVILATSGVLARFPLLLPVRNSFASYGASAVARTSDRGHVTEA
jgi:hypothetical protein